MHAARTVQYVLSGVAILALAVAAGCTPKYPKCEKDSHCEEKGELCVENTCQQCRDDSSCTAGQMCKGGACVAKPECASKTDCAGNKICRSGKCQLECEKAADCGSGLKCMDNQCMDELACGGPGDCAGGLTCVNSRCAQSSSQISMARCLYPTVQFEFNRASLSSSVRAGLKEVVDCMSSRGGQIIVEGHCDERGTEEFNLALGDRRARVVAEYLKTLGVPSSKMSIVSKGEVDPVNTGSSEAAWAENRRAEFIER